MAATHATESTGVGTVETPARLSTTELGSTFADVAAFAKIPIVQLALVVGLVTAIVWIVIPGPVAIVVSLLVTGVLALRGLSDSGTKDHD